MHIKIRKWCIQTYFTSTDRLCTVNNHNIHNKYT
jgi:hypothetical protein